MNRQGKSFVLLRIVCSSMVGVLFLALFIDIHGLVSQEMAKTAARLQFVPSLLSFMQSPALGAAFFLLILGLTAVFGRLYCSFFCPLGAMFDVMRWLSRRRRGGFSRSRKVLRYAFFLAAVAPLTMGSAYVVGLLDPYSMFGRLSTVLARPVAAVANNGLSRVLELGGVYALAPVRGAVSPVGIALVLAVVLGLLFFLAARHGRLYCNTVCPVGTLLGLAARFSRVGFHIGSACTACGRCERVCRASCIDHKAGVIDLERCVCCFDCLEACPEQAVVFAKRPSATKATHGKGLPTRRNFLVGLALASSAVPLAGRAEATQLPPVDCGCVPSGGDIPASPPGSVGIDAFLDSCTGCQLCMGSCPTHVLTPSLAAYGPGGFLLPRLEFTRGFCNYNCTVCLDVCPTGAIRPLSVQEKRRTQLGKAVFVRENCVVVARKTACGACAEHCPTKAVRMEHEPGLPQRLKLPKLTSDICVGCGACEFACPTRPYRAIYVQGNPTHLQASPPAAEPDLESPIDSADPFPF